MPEYDEEDFYAKLQEEESTQTPEQFQQEARDRGVNIERLAGAGKAEHDYGDRPPGWAPSLEQQLAIESAPEYRRPAGPAAELGDYSKPFYSRLERDAEGNLRGVGPATIYDRQGIAARALAGGNLPMGSDLYQEQAGGPPRPQVLNRPPTLDEQIAQFQLNQFEQAQLTQAQNGASQVSQRLMAGSITGREAAASMGAYNQIIDNLRSRQAAVAQLTQQKAQQELAQQRLQMTGMDVAEQRVRLQESLKAAERDPDTGLRMIWGKNGPEVHPADLHAAKSKGQDITPQKANAAARAEASGLYPGGSASTATNHADWKKAYAASYHDQMKEAGKLEMPKVDDFMNDPTGFVSAVQDYANQEMKKKGMAPPQGQPQAQAPQPFTKFEMKQTQRQFDADVKAIRELQDVPPIIKTNAVMALTGIKELLERNDNNPANFDDDERKQFMALRQQLEQIQPKKPMTPANASQGNREFERLQRDAALPGPGGL